jgi:hypothetical protein
LPLIQGGSYEFDLPATTADAAPGESIEVRTLVVIED